MPKPLQRIQHNLLAVGERRLLTWLCSRQPGWVTPDMLTAIGFGGTMCVFAGYTLSMFHAEWLWLAIVGYCINWFGDSLDGSLARFRKTERPSFGYFIDHSIDSIGNLIAMIGLGLSPYVRLDVALLGVASYSLMSIHTFLAARVVAEFRLSYLAGGPTELRLILIAMILCMLGVGQQPPLWFGLSVFDLFVGFLGVGLIAIFVVRTWVTARLLRDKIE